MATIEQVRANQEVWEDKRVIVTLKDGTKVTGKLDPTIGALRIGDELVAEADIKSIERAR